MHNDYRNKVNAGSASSNALGSESLHTPATTHTSSISGKHLCQFYFTKKDLLDILVPYFSEGLSNDEFCLWVTSGLLKVEDARKALRKAVPNLNDYVRNGQIEILPRARPYVVGGQFDANRLLSISLDNEGKALHRGFEGLRVSGDCAWVKRRYWTDFTDYEAKVNDMVPLHRITALCTYSLDKCTGTDILTVLNNHAGTY